MNKSILLKLHAAPSPLWVIFEVNLLRHLSIAVLSAIMPIYLRQFVDSDAKVSFIFLIGYCAALVSNLLSCRIIEHLKKRRALIVALMCVTILFALFAIANRSALVLLVFAIYQFMLALLILDISLYVKHYSDYSTIASNTGKLGALGNISWIVGPLLGSLMAEKYTFETVFLFSSGISLIALATFFFVRLKHEEIHFTHSRPFAANIRFFFKDAALRKTYLNNAGLGFIYSLWDMLSLLMLKLGATLPVIGMTRTLMGVPQAIFEYPVGQLADRETGERKLFILGYFLAAAGTIALGLITNMHLFITFFFVASVGTAFLEMTRDSYFFRQVSEKSVELISVYRTSDTLPFIVGQAMAVLVLSLASIEWLFIIGGMLALFFLANAYFLKDIAHGNR